MVVLLTLLRGLFARLWPFLVSLSLNFLKTSSVWVVGLVVVFLLVLTDVGKEIFLWSFDNLLSIVDYCLSLIVLPPGLKALDFQGQFNSLPLELIGLLGYIGIPQSLAIIASAVVVRFMRDILHF